MATSPAAFDEFLRRNPSSGRSSSPATARARCTCSRLLADRKDQLKGRLVAAYVVGWPIGIQADLPALGLPACTRPDQAGCILSWLSFAEPANPVARHRRLGRHARPHRHQAHASEDMLCVNPISGTRTAPLAPADNPGTLVPTADLASADVSPRPGRRATATTAC